MSALHEKSAAHIPAPDDSPWIRGHRHSLTNFRASPFSRRATGPRNLQKSWWTQPVCSFSALTRPQSPRSLIESPSKDTVCGKARNMEKCVFPSWTAPQAAHHNCTINYKLKKFQRIAEVPTLWLGRDLNLCLPISRGCLLVRDRLFHRD